MLTRHTISIDNRTVYYWERNPGASHTIVFIHGFRGNHLAFTDFSAYFENSRTIILDLPGYGLSQTLPVKHTIKNYAEFLDKFFTTLNLQQFDLVGHSYGGSIAIVYAGTHPQLVNHLVLISPAIPIDFLSQKLARIQIRILKNLPNPWKKWWLSSPIIEFLSTMTQVKTVSRQRKFELLARGLKNAKIQKPDVIIECLDSYLTTPFFIYARRINSPTLILAGETDLIAPIKTQVLLGEEINLSRIEFMPEIGHLAPIERPKTVGRIIDQFLVHNPDRPTHVHRTSSTTFAIQPRQHKIVPTSTQGGV